MTDAGAWDARYREKPLLWSAGPNRFVEERLAGLPTGTAVDVACGEGRNAVWLAQQGWEVTGVDFSAVALARARSMADERHVRVHWVRADVATWTPEAPFDLVLVAYLHLPPAERDAVMERCVSWVAPGGRLFLVGHDVAGAGVSGPPDPHLLWTPSIARELLSPLVVDDARTVERPMDSGAVALDTVVMAHRGSTTEG